MSVEGHPSVRKPRADAERNRERLLEAAKAGFSETGPDVTLDEIARRAGVGIGTLYRHFPTRDAIVEAVYRRDVQQLAAAAGGLLETLSPGEALRAWLRLLVDYVSAKKVIVAALSPASGGPTALYAASGASITDAVTMLVERAIAAGDIRPDVTADDLMRVLAGFYGSASPGWEASARKMIDVVMDGLRVVPKAD